MVKLSEQDAEALFALAHQFARHLAKDDQRLALTLEQAMQSLEYSRDHFIPYYEDADDEARHAELEARANELKVWADSLKREHDIIERWWDELREWYESKVELIEDYKRRLGEDEDDGIECNTDNQTEKEFEEALSSLDDLIGLESVKERIREIAALVRFDVLRKQQGMNPRPINLHMVFSGNPGTGKNEVARRIGKIYKALGLLEHGDLYEVGPELVGQYVGETPQKVKAVVEEALGGVLFIDEAYSLVSNQGGMYDHGREAINTLLKLMEDHREEFVVVAAGYPDKMNDFLDANPGFRSRFSHVVNFDDYSPAELVEVTAKFAEREQFDLTEKAKTKLLRVFQKSAREAQFANAREARNIFEKMKINCAKRVMAVRRSLSDSELRQIRSEDVPES